MARVPESVICIRAAAVGRVPGSLRYLLPGCLRSRLYTRALAPDPYVPVQCARLAGPAKSSKPPVRVDSLANLITFRFNQTDVEPVELPQLSLI